MHMVSKKHLNSAELETIRTSRSPTTVMTTQRQGANKRRATVYVKELDSFVTVALLEETPPVLSGSPAGIMGFHTTIPAVKKPHHIKNGKRIDCNISNYVPFVVSGFISEFLYDAHTYFFTILITGFRIDVN